MNAPRDPDRIGLGVELSIDLGPDGMPCLLIQYTDEFYIGMPVPSQIRDFAGALVVMADLLEATIAARQN